MPTTTQLLGHWTHSHEEDHEGCTVYRPASYAFPPARGRAALELRMHDWSDHPIAPGDGNTTVPGCHWTLSPSGSLSLYQHGQTKPARVMKIISVSQDKLIVREGDESA